MNLAFYACAALNGVVMTLVLSRMSTSLYGKAGWIGFGLGFYGLLLAAVMRTGH